VSRRASGSARGLHHVEIWVDDLDVATHGLGWLLERLGWLPYQAWGEGRSWRAGDVYLVLEASLARRAGGHDRMRPGLNHLALHAGTPEDVEALVAESRARGFRLLFADQHPHAGGPDTYAAYLESPDGFEVELVADVASVTTDGTGRDRGGEAR
jgi:catechol 2,3-dioxygenase-like lactoylglutathione lyase family enzyme